MAPRAVCIDEAVLKHNFFSSTRTLRPYISVDRARSLFLCHPITHYRLRYVNYEQASQEQILHALLHTIASLFNFSVAGELTRTLLGTASLLYRRYRGVLW